MKLPTESFASDVLVEVQDDLRVSVMEGFRDYLAEYQHVSARHSGRTRANIIHDHITDHAGRRLSTFHFVTPILSCGRRLFDVHGELLLHFKRLDDRLLGRNYPTQLALDFSLQHHLPGLLPSLPRLTVGYVPDRHWTAITGVFITCSKGRHLMWAKNISDDGSIPQLLSLPDAPPVGPKRRVAAKDRSKRRSTG